LTLLELAALAFGQQTKIKNQFFIKYSLNTLSGVTSQQCPSPRLCARSYTSRLQRWRV